jgi:hypothetical protein
MLGDELRPAVLFYFLGQCAHGFLGDFDAVAAIDRGFRDIDGGENFRAATFPLDPKRYCRLHRIFGALEPATLDGLPDKILLLECEVYLHKASVCRPAPKVKETSVFNAVAEVFRQSMSERNCSRADLRAHCRFLTRRRGYLVGIGLSPR